MNRYFQMSEFVCHCWEQFYLHLFKNRTSKIWHRCLQDDFSRTSTSFSQILKGWRIGKFCWSGIGNENIDTYQEIHGERCTWVWMTDGNGKDTNTQHMNEFWDEFIQIKDRLHFPGFCSWINQDKTVLNISIWVQASQNIHSPFRKAIILKYRYPLHASRVYKPKCMQLALSVGPSLSNRLVIGVCA